MALVPRNAGFEGGRWQTYELTLVDRHFDWLRLRNDRRMPLVLSVLRRGAGLHYRLTAPARPALHCDGTKSRQWRARNFPVAGVNHQRVVFNRQIERAAGQLDGQVWQRFPVKNLDEVVFHFAVERRTNG